MSGNPVLDRSRPFRGRARGLALLPLAAFLTYVAWSHVKWGFSSQTMFLSTFFGVMALLIAYFMLSGVFWKSFTHLPPAAGRVLAIIPVYNEDKDLVHEVVRSMLKQTFLPDAIHVVDDGSAKPLETFDRPPRDLAPHRELRARDTHRRMSFACSTPTSTTTSSPWTRTPSSMTMLSSTCSGR